MIEIPREPSPKQLRWFGALVLVFFGALGGILRTRGAAAEIAQILWGTGAALALLYYAAPPLRRPLYLGWMYAVWPVGWLVSHLLLAAIFYLVLTPVGLALRLAGRDPLARRFEAERRSYWIEHDPGSDPGRYFRQF